MIKRESYMKRIRPFFGNGLVKALIGLRRSGKSVMLDLIKEELCASGVDSSQFISINFENMRNAHLCTAVALHDEIIRRASEIKDKVYLFFDEIQEVDAWENVSILFAWNWTAIFISLAPMPNCFPANWRPIWPDDMWSL